MGASVSATVAATAMATPFSVFYWPPVHPRSWDFESA